MDVVKHGKELCFCEKAAVETGEQIPENTVVVFFGGGSFSMTLMRRRTVVQLGSLGAL